MRKTAIEVQIRYGRMTTWMLIIFPFSYCPESAGEYRVKQGANQLRCTFHLIVRSTPWDNARTSQVKNIISETPIGVHETMTKKHLTNNSHWLDGYEHNQHITNTNSR